MEEYRYIGDRRKREWFVNEQNWKYNGIVYRSIFWSSIYRQLPAGLTTSCSKHLIEKKGIYRPTFIISAKIKKKYCSITIPHKVTCC